MVKPGGGKRNPNRIKTAAGVMHSKPGHKSKSGRKAIPRKRWLEEKQVFLNEELANGFEPHIAELRAEKRMSLSFRIKSKKGK